MGKVKRITCIILAALTIISAPLTSYMEAQAGELVLDIPFIEQLLIMFGINAGLGEQHGYWKRQSELKELFEAAAEGGTAELEGYGTVNFSETESLKEWFEWSLNCQKFLLGNLSVVNPQNAARYMEVGKALDEVSYKNSGTCATNALNDNISDVYEEYKIDPQKVLENIQEVAKMVCSPDTEITDISDAEARAEFNKNFWKIFCAIAAAGMLGVGNAAVPISALKIYSDSEFNGYDAVFEEGGFTDFEVSDGMYHVVGTTRQINNENAYTIKRFDATVSDKVAAVYDGSVIYFYSLTGGYPRCSLSGSGTIYENGKVKQEYTFNEVSTFCVDGAMSFNIPVFKDMESLKAYAVSSDTSDILNLKDAEAYANFKSNTGTANAVIGKPFSGYVGALRSLADLIDIIPSVREASDTYGGTSEMLPEIARILSEAGDLAVDKPDADDPSSSSNYSGILAKILAAINSLPSKIVTAFSGKFMTAERLETLINGIPIVLAGVLSDAFSDSQISVLPGILSDVLSSVFPDAASAINALTDLPAVIISAISGIQIKVPEIVIPEIAVPDVFVEAPAVTLNPTFDVTVPNVFVDAPVLTLNPSYAITVANDYAGLDEIIAKAVTGVMTDVFVPNEAATLEKVGEMQEYFKFTEDMEDIISEFEKSVFGITPSPILKIPIGKPKSKKYNFGTGSHIIIDVSWYAEYKDFGDRIILALVWAMFIWRIFVLLPGIVSGGVGGFFETRDLMSEYSINKSYKDLDNLRPKYTSKSTHGD